tara:strand:- start:533 stop:640 length:108 start_codon:yes stop_codon:yes gene_type:complete
VLVLVDMVELTLMVVEVLVDMDELDILIFLMVVEH